MFHIRVPLLVVLLDLNPICRGELASASGFSIRLVSLRSTNHMLEAAKISASKARNVNKVKSLCTCYISGEYESMCIPSTPPD